MKTKTNKRPLSHKRVVKGVYVTPSGKYIVRPTVNGKRLHISFTNKSKAIKFYKSL